MKLYAATSNAGKLREFSQSTGTVGYQVLPLPGLADLREPIEDAPTFQGNADLKARAYSLAAPGLLVFADDSGLEVAALDGAPGVRSARFADDYARASPLKPVISTGGALLRRSRETPVFRVATDLSLSKDDRNNALLLHLMQPHTDRRARFICTLALARNGEVLLRAEGSVAGEILPSLRGTGGFGYDPLFLLPDLGLTISELPRDQKWQLSHRGNAFRSLLSQLIGTDIDSSPNSLDNRLSDGSRP
jgi:XTP/dITP diphosphohydrolase